ncbi:DUF6416 domain-containing protein [Mycolicibacterium chubuense]|uniref:DUF6416 domain-containing protein n=1 Tax=Mycolicibacterium chubuense TaxID=1800 RepID=UPI00191C1F8C|nr:DUF6416 domain-containing protein [Mycolicibacterium chubuense]
MAMIDMTVKVPEERVADFYQMYGAWLNGEPAETATVVAASTDRDLKSWSSVDEELAAEVWGRLSEPAKRLFSILIDNPGQRFSGQDLADLLDISNGKHGVAGLLGWPGRHCHAVNREWLWSFAYPDGELAEYWLTPENADLFRGARDRGE